MSSTVEKPVRQGYIGAGVPRIDGEAYVTGQAVYAADLRLPGMLHAALLHSRYPHARIIRVDTSAAEAVPGVRAVITAKDVPNNLIGYCISDRPIIAADKVRSLSDVIAAVAAEDEDTARRAVDLIDVEYAELPAVFSVEDSMKPDAPLIHETKSAYRFRPFLKPGPVLDRSNMSTHFKIRHGNVDTARQAADVVVTGRFRTQRAEHCSMEPHAAVAGFDWATGKLTLWASTGKPFRTLDQTALGLGITSAEIKMIQMPTGGDFGGKGEPTVEPICALLALKTRRPVKAVYGRDQEFTASTSRLPFDTSLTVGADSSGRLLFMQGEIWVDTGPYNGMAGQVATLGSVCLSGPYSVPNVHVDAYCVYTNNTLVGAFRGFGNPQTTFAREQLLDEVARSLNMDPLELRNRNAWGPGSITATGQVLDPNRYGVGIKECLDAVGRASQWAEAAKRKQDGKGRYRRGIGVAAAHHGMGGGIFAGADTSTIILKANMDGTVTLMTGTSDVGQGSNTTIAQVVATELGLPLSRIALAPKDSDAVPWEGGASASRVMYLSGNSAQLAAVALRDKLKKVAANMLEASPTDIVCEGERLFVIGVVARAVTVSEVVRFSMNTLGEQPFGMGTCRRPIMQLDEEGRGSPFASFDFGAQVAEVEVDTLTGQVRVLRLTAADDVGKAINPVIVEGQIIGAAVQGIGYALHEEVVLEQGQVLNPSFADYRVPRTEDVPPIHSVLVEQYEASGPYGAKGAGETGIVPTAAAIANAIYDAVGVRMFDLPITAEKVFRAMNARSEGQT